MLELLGLGWGVVGDDGGGGPVGEEGVEGSYPSGTGTGRGGVGW